MDANLRTGGHILIEQLALHNADTVFGVPGESFLDALDGLYQSQQRFGLYRWHVLDPIHFATDLRVEIQALGWQSGGRYRRLHDDIASTALFYLDQPSTRRPTFPDADTLQT